MKSVVPSRGERLSRRQALFCLVLVGLLLYNPFAGLCGANDGLSYEQLARNRATLGASELQHFSPITDHSSAQTELDLDIPATGLLPVVREELSRSDFQQRVPPQTELLNEFSNKPPPSL